MCQQQKLKIFCKNVIGIIEIKSVFSVWLEVRGQRLKKYAMAKDGIETFFVIYGDIEMVKRYPACLQSEQ